jgi:hypothetical protein
LIGALVAAVGAALAGVPDWVATQLDMGTTTALRWTFVLYAALGVALFARYRHLSAPSSHPGVR